MIPLRDVNPTRTFPAVTVLVIAANVLVFLYELILPSEQALARFVSSLGVIPYEIVHNVDLPPPSLQPIYLTLFTAMFLHGGPIHIIGNMLYLWIFGNNVEDVMGSLRFMVFYLLCGLGASATQIAVGPNSRIPNIGASGAIAGVLGAYILLFPRARVDTLLILGYVIRIIQLPAILVLGFWFVIQLFSGIVSLGMPQAGGVAWFAHIGGFAAGALLVHVFRRRRW
ncbi:MAG TPA: rhomboid family intramembrane serine protease [Anaerolineae bacterium]|nr:rhomboid family intramembrane serine protease [Anaerolineae bacterium]